MSSPQDNQPTISSSDGGGGEEGIKSTASDTDSHLGSNASASKRSKTARPKSAGSQPTPIIQTQAVSVLAQYQCPMQQDYSVPACHMASSVVGCPFGHLLRPISPSSTTSPNGTAGGLRVIPAVICVDHLLSRCSNQTIPDPGNAKFIRCVVGFHPGPEDFADLDRYRRLIGPQTRSSPLSCSLGAPTLFTINSSSGCPPTSPPPKSPRISYHYRIISEIPWANKLQQQAQLDEEVLDSMCRGLCTTLCFFLLCFCCCCCLL